MSDVPTLETVRAWATTGGIFGILLGVLRFGKPVADYLIESRRLKMQEKKDDRQGFGELIEALTEQVKALKTEVIDLRTENGALREEVRQLHGIIDGMRRGDLSAKLSAQRDLIDVLPETSVSPHLKRALNKLDEMKSGGDE